MLINEEYIDRTAGLNLGSSGFYEPFTDDIGRLFKALKKENGKCVSKIYEDKNNKQIGWVFQRKLRYEDVDEHYIRETWVTVHEKKPETKVQYKNFYYDFSKKGGKK